MTKQEYKRICHLYRYWMWAIGTENSDTGYTALMALPQKQIRIAEQVYNWWQNRDLFIRYAACTPQYWNAQASHRIKPDYSRYEEVK